MKQINLKVTDFQKKKIDELASINGISVKELILKATEAYEKEQSIQNIDGIIDILSKQIEEKDEQIKKLSQLLNQQQQLSASHMKKIEMLEIDNRSSKKSWWEKFLGR